MSTAGNIQAAAGFKRLLSAAALTAAAACTSVNPVVATFEGTSWQVTAINGMQTPVGGNYQIRFTDGRVSGRFGCNQFGGPYQVQGGLLIVTDVASTLMGCPAPSVTFESEGIAILRQPMRIDWQSGRQLTLSNGVGLIALQRMN